MPKKGQLLFVLDRPDLEMNRQQAEQKLTTLTEQYDRRKVDDDGAIHRCS